MPTYDSDRHKVNDTFQRQASAVIVAIRGPDKCPTAQMVQKNNQ